MAQVTTIKVDFRALSAVLLAAIIVMLVLWKPWSDAGPSRRITVSGQSSIDAEPDHYLFNPTYQKTAANRTAATTALTAKIRQVTDKLKELGVKDSDIELQSNSYEQYYREPDAANAAYAYLSIKVESKDLAQKVQDYLLTTESSGSITPRPTFSDEKRESLESEARDKAVADAQEEAERTAKQLGARLGRVIEVKDVTGGGGIYPVGLESGATTDSDAANKRSSLPVFPGEQDVSFTVQVIFEIK